MIEFFATLAPAYKILSNNRPASELLENVYEKTTERVLDNIEKEEGGKIGVFGAIDNIATAI